MVLDVASARRQRWKILMENLMVQPDSDRNRRQAFEWNGYHFFEIIQQGCRSVVLRFSEEEEFIARSEPFLREDAAAAILKSDPVLARLKAIGK